MRDWQRQNWLLHNHNNHRFVRGTPRGLPQPVIQMFERRRHCFGDLAATVVVFMSILALSLYFK